MFAVKLENAPPYEALSYVWGIRGPDIDSRIIVNGHDYAVMPVLFEALQAVRKSDGNRLMWVDAVCIDQNDLDDKYDQINIMGMIYEKAESVVVSLGQATEKTAEAVRAFQYLVDSKSSAEEPPWSHAELAETEEVLQDVLARPWFTRVWTVQEATLARHTRLLLGKHEVSWSGDLRNLRAVIFRIKLAAISPYFTVAHGYISALDWSTLLDILETQMRQAARREKITVQ